MPGITLFVLGMHRSGTSAMTGALNICGAWVGNEAELTQASVENPNGFWERRDIREICDKLLQSAGADWWKIAGFDPKAIPRTILTEQRRKFQKIILTLDEYETWVIKEPRLCLLLPVLRQYVRNPVCIYMYRNPLEVARSLQVRNGFSISSGLALWQVYNFHALKASEGLPRIFVSFEALMIHPIETLKEIAEKLEELVGSHTVKPERKLIEQFIDPNLYRQRVTEEETCDYLLPSQQALWSRLHNDEALDDYKNFPISEATTQSLLDLESVEVSFNLHQDTKNELQARIVKYTAALKAREERIGTLEGSNSRLQTNLDKHKETLKAREERIGTLEGSNNRLQTNLGKHKETLKAREERIGTLEGSNSRLQTNLGKHKETLKAREERIGTLEGSNSRLQTNLGKHKETLKAREERIGTLEGSNSRLQTNLGKHKETLKAREERIGTLEGSNSRLQTNLDKHTATIKAREKIIDDLYNSTSWKITAPLRVISRSFRWLLRNFRRVLRLLFWLSTGQFSRAKKAVIHHYTRLDAPQYISKLITGRRREYAPQEINSKNSNQVKSVSTRTVASSQDTTYIVPSSWWEQNPMAVDFITKTAQAVIILGSNRIPASANVTVVAGIQERVLALAAVTTETAIEIRADAKWSKAVENGELPQDGTIKLLTPDEMGVELGRFVIP